MRSRSCTLTLLLLIGVLLEPVTARGNLPAEKTSTRPEALQGCQGGKPRARGKNHECALKLQGFSQVRLIYASGSVEFDRIVVVFHGMQAMNPGEFNVTAEKFIDLPLDTLYVLPMEAGNTPTATLAYFKTHTIAEFIDSLATASQNGFLRTLKITAVAGHSWGGKTLAEAVGPRNPSIPKFVLLDASYIYDDRRSHFESFVKAQHARIACIYRNAPVLDRQGKDVSPAQGCMKNCTPSQPCLTSHAVPSQVSHMQVLFRHLGIQTR